MKKILQLVLILLTTTFLSAEIEQSTSTLKDAEEVKADYYNKVEEVGADNLLLLLGSLTNRVQLLSRRAGRAFEREDYESAILNWLKAKEIITDAKAKGAIKRLKSGVLQLDQVYLDSIKNEVYFYAKVPVLNESDNPNVKNTTMETMPFEVIIANPHGRIHETVFVTEARPFHLHTLLIMLGFQNGKVKSDQTPKSAVIGDILDVFVEYKTMAGETKSCHIEDLLFDSGGQKPMPAVGWYFNGPEIEKNRYIPDFCGELIVDMMGDNVLISTEKKLWNSQMEVIWKPKFDIDKRERVKISIRAR
ncbi:MAG: hypothetical protein KAG98_02655, partial [Lentisphaeria bacterium]|nr:hypothetical protein [Lentisphaeria bacterium]